ncbi:MAG: flagellar biosynthetic protein FliO [Burkholderiaceae bacterium]
MASNGLNSLLWFIAIVVMIPVVLWLLKRTPIGSAASNGMMRSVATLALTANQRIVTIEVGTGEARRWLVLGVSPQSITTLHTMEPQIDGPQATPPAATPFAQLLGRWRQDHGAPGER